MHRCSFVEVRNDGSGGWHGDRRCRKRTGANARELDSDKAPHSLLTGSRDAAKGKSCCGNRQDGVRAQPQASATGGFFSGVCARRPPELDENWKLTNNGNVTTISSQAYLGIQSKHSNRSQAGK